MTAYYSNRAFNNICSSSGQVEAASQDFVGIDRWYGVKIFPIVKNWLTLHMGPFLWRKNKSKNVYPQEGSREHSGPTPQETPTSLANFRNIYIILQVSANLNHDLVPYNRNIKL